MKIKQTVGLAAGAALALSLVACQETATTNTNNANAVVLTNSNQAVVVNNNQAVATANNNMGAPREYKTREEYEKDKDMVAKDAKAAGSTIGSGVNDGWLWTKARAALLTTNDLRESTINVDVDNAVVTLKGTVANAMQKAKAAEVVKALEGVKSVNNTLTVSAGDSMTNMNSNHNANMHNANTHK